jgi:hypothetical protein
MTMARFEQKIRKADSVLAAAGRASAALETDHTSTMDLPQSVAQRWSPTLNL